MSRINDEDLTEESMDIYLFAESRVNLPNYLEKYRFEYHTDSGRSLYKFNLSDPNWHENIIKLRDIHDDLEVPLCLM